MCGDTVQEIAPNSLSHLWLPTACQAVAHCTWYLSNLSLHGAGYTLETTPPPSHTHAHLSKYTNKVNHRTVVSFGCSDKYCSWKACLNLLRYDIYP